MVGSDSNSMTISRLPEVCLQDEVAEAQQAAQEALAHLHDLEQQTRFLTQKQLQLQSVVQGLEATKQTAKQAADVSGRFYT